MKKRFRKLVFNAVAVIMAVIMASLSSVQVFAAGRNRDRSTEGRIASGKTYVKDVIIVTESEACNLDGTIYGDYVVLTNPISDLSGQNGHEKLFFAVLTTDDPNEAITDIKAMNMNGDYDFDAYGDYLAEVEAWALAKADTTMVAVKEFRTNYEAGKPGALFAYNMLNYFVGDNEDVPLGEFFVNDAYKATLGLQVKNIVMKANLLTLSYIRQLLLVACSDTLGDNHFVNELLKHGTANELTPNDANNNYRTAAADLMYSMGTTREAILAYRDALAEYGDGLADYLEQRSKELAAVLSDEDKVEADEYAAADKEVTSLQTIISGQLLTEYFDEVYYIGNDGVKLSLTDILSKDPDDENEADRPTVDMLLPIVTLMSDGQRGLAGCGFDKLVGSIINDYQGEDSEHREALEKITEYWDTISNNEYVSVYAGVDLSLYDPNGIAMIGKNGEFLKEAQGDYSFLGISTLGAGLMAGGAVVGLASSYALFSAARNVSAMAAAAQKDVWLLNKLVLIERMNTAKQAMDAAFFSAGFADGMSAASEAGQSQLFQTLLERFQKTSAYTEYAGLRNQLLAEMPEAVSTSAIVMKALSAFVLVLSVALLVFSVVTLVMNAIHKDDPQDYTQVPRILVNAIEKTEYDERQQKMTSTQMIFYKGIIDPFMSDAKAEANKTPSRVMDVFDWSLTNKDREWIALYTTKDGRAGHPIIYDGADNTLAVLIGSSSSYAALEQNKGFNGRVNIFNKEDYTECGDGVIVFNSDLKVTSETKTGLGASMIINNGEFILFILIAATVGVGIGVGACLLVGNSRKKKESKAKTA